MISNTLGLLVLAIGGAVAHPAGLECGTDATSRLVVGATVMSGPAALASPDDKSVKAHIEKPKANKCKVSVKVKNGDKKAPATMYFAARVFGGGALKIPSKKGDTGLALTANCTAQVYTTGTANDTSNYDFEVDGCTADSYVTIGYSATGPKGIKLVNATLKSSSEQEAVTTASGLVIQQTKAGTGASPTADSTVRVHYEGKLENGQVFDSSIARGEPIDFPLSGVIKGWTEGLQLMKVGETAILTIPYDLAYGEQGQGPIPPKATLIFEVRLLAIM